MKPSNPGEKSFLTTKKKGNVIINPKKEDLMKETKLDEKKLDAVERKTRTSITMVTMISLTDTY